MNDLLEAKYGTRNLWLPACLAWLFSLIATFVSLFFSEVMRFPPCVLCWYQRIELYPLVLILTVGILNRDTKLTQYAWPFIALGVVTALYHNLLYYHVIPESISPCVQGVLCTERQIEWLGFVSIPLLSLLAFTLIGICMFHFQRNLKGIEQYEVR